MSNPPPHAQAESRKVFEDVVIAIDCGIFVVYLIQIKLFTNYAVKFKSQLQPPYWDYLE